MRIRERNRRAKENGCIGEEVGLNILRKIFNSVEFVNKLVDVIADDKNVEVKTCQEWQSNGNRRCRGRFVLDREQHNKLLKTDGYYLFIVISKFRYKFFLIKAKDVLFSYKLNWKRVESFRYELRGSVEYVRQGN
ncbi:MAG: hypothetical protein JRE40_12160 [Deltaproteobacteria bacterium]|nr:hypothetical protein [Deltaproteobacteria bacterium]